MNLLADTWIMWLLISVVSIAAVLFYRQSRRYDGESGFITSADEFSIKTILFGFRKGEGDLFIGYVVAMISFSLFLAGLVRWAWTIV